MSLIQMPNNLHLFAIWDALRYPELSQEADSHEIGAAQGTPVLGVPAADMAPLPRAPQMALGAHT